MRSVLSRTPKPFAREDREADRISGKLVTIQESEHQIITAYEVHDRRPADMTLWTPALDRPIDMFDRPLDIAAGDRGFASARNEEAAAQRRCDGQCCLDLDGKRRRGVHMSGSDGSAAASGGESGAKGASV